LNSHLYIVFYYPRYKSSCFIQNYSDLNAYTKKLKYNKDFFEYNIYRQKIKNLAKIRRPAQTNALGSKGQALRVFGIISTPRCTSGSILPKNLDSPIRPPNVKAIFFFFFLLLLLFFLFSGGKNYLRAQQL